MVGRVTEQTVDDVVRQVRDALTPEKVAQLDEIAGRMVDGEAQFRAFLHAIRGRSTATFYVNTSKLKQSSNGVTLSVRVSGVECGEVMLTKRRRERMFAPKHIEQHFTGCWTTSKTRLPWEHPEVRRYLQRASEMATALEGDLADRECGVEAALIQELRDGNLRHNAPILFPTKSGVPYQFPVPITARGGVRAAGGRHAGHIDILARHGKGRTSRLRVLEVKKPDADDAAHALDQAVAYAAALDALLGRSSKYRMLCGYPQYPPKLEATAVVADDDAIRRDIAAARERLAKRGGSLDVQLSALFYQWENAPGGRRLRIAHQIG